jgi:hypothetical protein
MEQQELKLVQDLPRTGHISDMEFAKVLDKAGNHVMYAMGTYEEVEDFCKRKGYWVDKYLDYVAPSTARQGVEYVGRLQDPYKLQLGFDYGKSRPIIDDSF